MTISKQDSKTEITPASEKETSRERDFELARQAAAGDIEAFEKLYWQHHRRVYNVCLQMTRNAHEAEDVTQKVFILVFRKISSFRGDAAFATWLHRMTVNQVLMHFRSAKSRKEQTTEDGVLPEHAANFNAKPRPNQVIDRVILQDAIEQLPEGYRKVVVLHDIQGFEHEEIARILGCATGTTKSQLHKARRKLRALLTGGDFDAAPQGLQKAT